MIGWMDDSINKRMYEWRGEGRNGGREGGMNGWMDDSINKRMYEWRGK